jgi:hypothetical protein
VNETDLFRGPDGEAVSLDGFADAKAVDPAKAAAEAVDASGPRGRKEAEGLLRIGILPKPRIILGVGTPWPAAVRDPAKPCVGCGGRRLSKLACCVRCDRSGIDHLLPSLTPKQPKQPRKDDGLSGGVGKAPRTPKVKPKPPEVVTPEPKPKKRAKGNAKPRKVKPAGFRMPGGFEPRNSFDLEKLKTG